MISPRATSLQATSRFRHREPHAHALPPAACRASGLVAAQVKQSAHLTIFTETVYRRQERWWVLGVLVDLPRWKWFDRPPSNDNTDLGQFHHNGNAENSRQPEPEIWWSYSEPSYPVPSGNWIPPSSYTSKFSISHILINRDKSYHLPRTRYLVLRCPVIRWAHAESIFTTWSLWRKLVPRGSRWGSSQVPTNHNESHECHGAPMGGWSHELEGQERTNIFLKCYYKYILQIYISSRALSPVTAASLSSTTCQRILWKIQI